MVRCPANTKGIGQESRTVPSVFHTWEGCGRVDIYHAINHDVTIYCSVFLLVRSATRGKFCRAKPQYQTDFHSPFPFTAMSFLLHGSLLYLFLLSSGDAHVLPRADQDIVSMVSAAAASASLTAAAMPKPSQVIHVMLLHIAVLTSKP